MPSSLRFELVSPEKLVLGRDAALVTVPGGEGDYGVLFGHAPMITSVRPGVIEVYEQEGGTATDTIFVAGGFAEVTGERCTILAEEAVPVAELKRADLDEQAKNLAEDINLAKSAEERATAEAALALVKAKLQAVAVGG
ncbi:MAG TPA: ATP synthase F1 subunit epsilon [Alphaproteobacteria bacterium]|nr:ATP synthase F1 subunit epsilon [Alphaproteobacteria bacterium]